MIGSKNVAVYRQFRQMFSRACCMNNSGTAGADRSGEPWEAVNGNERNQKERIGRKGEHYGTGSIGNGRNKRSYGSH